ncbi:PepSY-associated TM helix domain-containing protein [Sporomusa sp.]|uniref:PepSY-associated TM helix domain-containing protein n=1 Tax=Sporomusa sp. TaxID=2078658 RepID=UPI002C5DB3E1|nr:PepSY-associated TM helix domain-containing protein [Sporomusa sp.]HWR08820.1 PepSY-associated TM helix domain-containing protein [Sporomusa sp.]
MNQTNLNRTFTRSMSELHTWGGLVFGWLLFAIFFTGTLSVFEQEITHWMQPGARVSQTSPVQAVASADQKLRQLAPRADTWMIALPQGRHQDLEIIWKKGKATLERHLNPQTGAVLKMPATEGGHFFVQFHYELHSGKTGLWLVSLASVVMLAALVSGIAIRRQVFTDFFRLRWRKNWLAAHTLTGVLTLPFVILITYTGLTITFFMLLPTVPQVLYGSSWRGPAAVAANNFERPPAHLPGELVPLSRLLPLAEAELGKDKISFVRISNPGDRQSVITFFRTVDDTIVAMSARASFDGVTGEMLGSQSTWNKYVHIYRSLVGLHIARFGGYPISWLYFTAGLISCIMIAAGLIFFTVKRRSRYARSNEAAQLMYRAIEALNIAAVTGIVVACGAYLWSNRLLPPGVKDRADAEITVFFGMWLLMLIHALLRPPLRAWAEQLGLAAGLCIGLPALNALTSTVGLFPAIARGDWMTAGVDLTAALLGTVLAITAWRVALKQKKNQQPPDRILAFPNTNKLTIDR